MSDMNREKLIQLAEALGINNLNSDKMKKVEDAAQKYNGKGENEILQELKDLKSTLFKDKASFDRQMKVVKEIRPMLSNEQKMKFDKIMDILGKE